MDDKPTYNSHEGCKNQGYNSCCIHIFTYNGELSEIPTGWHARMPRPTGFRSNDLFERANQRAVGLIGRVRPRNSPFGRAQRGRTLGISGRTLFAIR